MKSTAPFDLIINNTTLVTCDVNHTIIENASMAISGNTICWVGPTKELESQQMEGVRTIDGSDKILMPGLINMHAHCGDSLFRGLVENLPLEPWLQNVWKAEAAILGSAENCRLGVELGFAELLLGGTTSVMDMFWHPDQTFAAAKEVGIRVAAGGIFFDFDGMDGNGPNGRNQEAQALFDAHGEDAENFVGTMPHGTYTVGPDSLKSALEITWKNKGFFCTHAAETKVEQQTIQERYQTSVIRHLNNLEALGNRTILAHCVHVDDTEIKLMADSGTHVVHNPMSNLKLASGFAPIQKMIDQNINVTLGTDGAISGNDMDMWLAMRLAATIHKAANEDPASITTHEALHMATLNGAKALGAELMLGSIEVNKRADFILVDIRGPHAMPMFNPIDHLIFSASKNDVSDVFVSGRQLVKDRQLLTLDLASITSRVTQLQPAIAASLKA